MKKLIFFMCVMMCTITSFAQTIYYQDLGHKTSIGVGVSDSIVLSVVNKDKQCTLSFADRIVISDFSSKKVGKNYIHNVTLTIPQYNYYKSLCKHGLVKINKNEYTGLQIGSALVGAEWYSEYYFNNKKSPFISVKRGPRPLIFRYKR